MTEQDQKTTMEKSLAKFSNIMQPTPVDVVLKLLQAPSLYHTEIPKPQIMNAIKLQIQLCKLKKYPQTEKFWTELYDSMLDHMVAHKRKRSDEIKEMFANVAAYFRGDQQEEKKGLFKR